MDYSNKTKEQLLAKFDRLAEKYKINNQDEENVMGIISLSKILREKGWKTDEEIAEALKGFSDTKMKYNPYENVKDANHQY